MQIGKSCRRLVENFGLKRVFTIVGRVKGLEGSQILLVILIMLVVLPNKVGALEGGRGSRKTALNEVSAAEISPLLLPCPRCQQVNKLVCSSYPLIVHRDHVISQEDFDDLNDRVRHYMDWSTNNMNYQTLKEVNWYLAI